MTEVIYRQLKDNWATDFSLICFEKIFPRTVMHIKRTITY